MAQLICSGDGPVPDKEPSSPASPVTEDVVSPATSQASAIPSSASPLRTDYSFLQNPPTESTPLAHIVGKRQLFPVTSPELVNGQSFSEEEYGFEAENQTTTQSNVLRELLANQQTMMEQATHTNRLLQQLVQNQEKLVSRLDAMEVARSRPVLTPTRNRVRPPLHSTTLNTSSFNRPSDEVNQESNLKDFCESARERSLSLGHFATMIIKRIFPEQEREGRNCTGSRGKVPLDPVKLEDAKRLVFRYYDTPDSEQSKVWKICISRIDEMLRRKSRNKENSGF